MTQFFPGDPRTCVLCERPDLDLTRHHLIPRTRHKNKKTKKETSTEDRNNIIMICRPCHDQIHLLITEKEMEREYNTLDKLKSHPGVQKFIKWISKRDIKSLKTKQ